MQTKKVLLSFLLIVVYALGFAHNLAPRCQEVVCVNLSNGNLQKKHNHNHIQHNETENHQTDHNHFVHANHCDEGIYDFVVCFLNEIEHPAHDCNVQNYLPSKSNKLSLKEVNKIKFTAVLLAVIKSRLTYEIKTGLKPNIEPDFTPPPLELSPHRGPPFLLC